MVKTQQDIIECTIDKTIVKKALMENDINGPSPQVWEEFIQEQSYPEYEMGALIKGLGL